MIGVLALNLGWKSTASSKIEVNNHCVQFIFFPGALEGWVSVR